MSTPLLRPGFTDVWNLPPLIVHPFAGREAAARLMDGSRAALMLHGLIDSDVDSEELGRRVLLGRHNEVQMLYYLGKDIFRWMEQCQEVVDKIEVLKDLGIRTQSFAALLVDTPPKCLTEKLNSWGVGDHRTMFSRAIGLRSTFEEAPTFEHVSSCFLKNHHRYADHLYACYQRLGPVTAINCHNFPFEFYGSEEYSRKLSLQFEAAE